jgi:hypothetical protein
MIILLVPTYQGGRNFELWSEWIYRLNPLPDKVIFLENNSTDDTLKNITDFKLPHEVIRIWLRDDINTVMEHERWEYLHIAHIRQLLLTRAKKLNPDYAIFIDDDTLPPHDMIPKFVEAKKDIIGGMYYRIFPEGMFLATKFYHIEEDCRKKNQYLLIQKEAIPNILGQSKYYQEKNLLQGNSIEVPMTSGGCLCLSRRAIVHPQLFFYPHPTKGILDTPASEDFGYCLRARRMGIRTYLHLEIMCRHLVDLRPNPRAWAVDQKGIPVKYKWE